jgi:hypothetical protein
MAETTRLYICPICFRARSSPIRCHAHECIECEIGPEGSGARKPLTDQFGQYVSRAPRWYLEAMGRIPAWTPYHPHSGISR